MGVGAYVRDGRGWLRRILGTVFAIYIFFEKFCGFCGFLGNFRKFNNFYGEILGNLTIFMQIFRKLNNF